MARVTYTAQHPKVFNMTGAFKRFSSFIVERKNPKTGEIQRRIKLNGQNTQKRIQKQM